MNLNMSKKIISFVITLAMIFSLAAPALASNADVYTDFPSGWSREAMIHAVDNGLLNGRTATTINPQDNLTRAEMATIINRVFGATIKADISKFTDVSPSDWYYSEIAKAVNMRTFQGNSGSTMNPEAYITREQVFVAIARALVLDTQDYSVLDKYSDSANVSDWAKGAAAVLVSKGYVNGYGNTGTFCPKANITREEFAQIMYNIIKTYYVVPGTYNAAGEDSSLIRTTDVTLSDVTIDGDLVIGDGVGKGKVTLKNVVINGRLLCRGGEGSITLVNTTAAEGVVVNDVNGTVHFNNYRTESIFNNIILNTPATFKKRISGGSSITPTPPDPPTPPVETYYTVSFHDGATEDVFDTFKVKDSLDAANRTLSYAGKNLDTIYAGKLDEGYTYNRNDIPYTGLGATYTHTVEKEYLYKKSNGIWDVFTNDTQINGDIDVYYGQKHAVAEIDKTVFGINPVIEISYDSQSRFFDSFKDGMISAGLTLSQNVVRDEINSKMATVFEKAYNKTGMIDTSGNILDKDYGLKIADVISYEQMKGEVNAKIRAMLNGSADELRSVITLIDMGTLVENIGGRKLIEAIGISSIRSMLESDEYKSRTIEYIQTELKKPSSAQLVEKVLSTSAKDALIDSAASNNAFIVALLDNSDFQNEILAIIKTDRKDLLLEYLEKQAIKDEIISTIKKDSAFESLLDNASFTNTIVDLVKDSQEFKDILIGDSDYKDKIIEEIKTTKVADFADIFMDDADVKKEMVEKVGDPGKYDDEKSELALKTKRAIMNIINTNDDYAEYRTAMSMTNAYEAVIQFYVTGRNSTFTNVSFRPAEFRNIYVPMIDSVIETVVNNFISYDPEDESAQKPEGYDIINDYFDEYIDDILVDYANGDLENEDIMDLIEEELPAQIENAIKDYIDETATLDPAVEEIIDDSIIDFVKRYVNGESLDADIVTVIESNIIKFIKSYFDGSSALAQNEDLATLAESIKGQFIAKVKAADINKIKQPVIEFIQNPDNASFVDDFVADKYINILDAVDDDFIMGYLDTMTDDQINDLVIEYATVDMIIEHISELSDAERQELAETVVGFLDSYTPFVNFMNSFKNKEDNFEVNKDNIHFVSAIGEAINGFDFDDILEILNEKGYGNIINVLGEDIVEDMFVAAKTDYWQGLEPVIEAVKADEVPRYYTTSLTVNINAPLILHSVYKNYSKNFVDAVENKGIYDYENNLSLKKFVNIDWFNVIIGYDPSRVDEAAGITGYYFKEYMQYYTSMLDAIILYDQALCFYDTENYTDEELIDVKKSLTKDFVTFIKNLEKLSDNIEQGKPIVGSYTLNDLISRVDSIKSITDSLGSTPLGGFESNINSVIDNVKEILTNLGQGDLPNGYTFDDLEALAQRLNSVIDAMTTNQYESANSAFETLINNSVSKLSQIITELDEDGSISGKPIDVIVSKVSALNSIYSKYEDKFKAFISALADAKLDSLEIKINLEKYEDIIFGREEENVFNIDTVVNVIKTKISPSVTNKLDARNGKFITDGYSKTIKDITVSFERNFY